MQKYKCTICNYSTSRALNLSRHNNSKKHLKKAEEYEPKNNIDATSPIDTDTYDAYSECSNDSNDAYSNDAKKEKSDTEYLLEKYHCCKCDAVFTHHQSYYRHIKWTCKYRNDEIVIHNKHSNNKIMKPKSTQKISKNSNVIKIKAENVTKIISEKNKEIDKLLQENKKMKEENKKIKKEAEKKIELIEKKQHQEIEQIKQEKVKTIEQLKKEKIKKIEEIEKEKDKRIEQIVKEKDDIIEIAKNTAITSKNTSESSTKSLSMLKCAMKHFRNAPPMKQLDGKDAMKLITYEPDGEVDENNKHTIEEIIIFKYSKGILVDFVGDIIVCCYKKDNPKYQSMWGTDYARLAFIIKQFVGDDGESEWVKDPNGLKVLKLIIIPIYDKIKEMLHEYVKKVYKDISSVGLSHTSMTKLTKNSEIALTIIGLLSMNKIKKDTLRYISSHFGFDAVSVNSLKDYDSPEILSSSDTSNYDFNDT